MPQNDPKGTKPESTSQPTPPPVADQTPKTPEDPTEKKERDYTFNYSWPLVVKAFWDKYPNEKLDFVKYNKLIGLDMDEKGVLKLKRVQHIKKWGFLWAYIIEEITIDPKDQIMEMHSHVLKKSDLIPIFGNEYISYRAVEDLKDKVEKTLYSKRLVIEGTINKALSSFSDSFAKGIKIVEDNCEVLKSLSTEEWVRRFSLLK
jgi:hypothetical protein